MTLKKFEKEKVYSHKTAMTRRAVSLPTKYLLKNNLLNGSILDFGCGKGFDSSFLKKRGYEIYSYDPYWNINDFSKREYDTVICNYVLNVLKEGDQERVINSVLSVLKKTGAAYFSVRRDLKADGWTSRGYQRRVSLKEELIHEKRGSFAIYKINH